MVGKWWHLREFKPRGIVILYGSGAQDPCHPQSIFDQLPLSVSPFTYTARAIPQPIPFPSLHPPFNSIPYLFSSLNPHKLTFLQWLTCMTLLLTCRLRQNLPKGRPERPRGKARCALRVGAIPAGKFRQSIISHSALISLSLKNSSQKV